MEPFTVLTSVAAVLEIDNVDTDMIIPKLYLKTIRRSGLGLHLFHDMRYNKDGSQRPDFILNRDPYRQAKILISGENFGCGSSREHAPWALADFGIRVVIAPSFADIFFSNIAKNGILALQLERSVVSELSRLGLEGKRFTVDLEQQRVQVESEVWSFDVDPFQRKCLLEGLDDIDLILQRESAVRTYEEEQRDRFPWLA